MIEFPKADKKVLIILGLLLCFIAGFGAERLYQPDEKTIQIYTQGLKDYNNKNYSNAYYLFSRIGKYSKLKPAALYRQGLCARALNDEKSELIVMENLFKNYSADKLKTEAKYRSAQLLMNSNPQKEKKHHRKRAINAKICLVVKKVKKFIITVKTL